MNEGRFHDPNSNFEVSKSVIWFLRPANKADDELKSDGMGFQFGKRLGIPVRLFLLI